MPCRLNMPREGSVVRVTTATDSWMGVVVDHAAGIHWWVFRGTPEGLASMPEHVSYRSQFLTSERDMEVVHAV